MPNPSFIKDVSPVVRSLSRFLSFIQYKDEQLSGSFSRTISFSDSNGFLGMEEGYKSGIAEKAREELHFKEWKETWIEPAGLLHALPMRSAKQAILLT